MDERRFSNQSIPDFQLFESAFAAGNPMESLKNRAIELSNGGMKRRGIYDRFMAYFRYLIQAERVDDETIFGEVLDMISDPHYRDFLNLPE